MRPMGVWHALGLLAFAFGVLLLMIGWRGASVGFLVFGLVFTALGLGMFLWGPHHPALTRGEVRCRSCSGTLPFRKEMGGTCAHCGTQWQQRIR